MKTDRVGATLRRKSGNCAGVRETARYITGQEQIARQVDGRIPPTRPNCMLTRPHLRRRVVLLRSAYTPSRVGMREIVFLHSQTPGRLGHMDHDAVRACVEPLDMYELPDTDLSAYRAMI